MPAQPLVRCPLERGELADQVRKRDPLTRFSRARGPLTTYPGKTPAEVAAAVRAELERLPWRVG